MNDLETLKVLLSAVRSVICDEKFELDETIDFEHLYNIAVKHKIEVLVGYAFLPYKDSIAPEKWSMYEKSMYMAAMDEVNRDYAVKELDRVFTENDIDYMHLKGHIIKNIYPISHMRTMSDLDILVKPEQRELIYKLVGQMGYKIAYENVREFNYIKKVAFEFHLDMISEKYKLYHDYYEDIWYKGKKIKDNLFELSDEDYFIYHIVHMAKHYKGAGTGIRSFVDVFVFLKNKQQFLDWDYIYSELGKINLEKFAKNVISLSQMWFVNGNTDEKLKKMAEYVYASGVYGCKAHAEVFRTVQVERMGGARTIISMVFPDMHVMSELYPILIKYKFLLPFFWIKRLVCKAKRKEYGKALHKVFVKNTLAENISNHFDDIGL